ncbi:hypothetical protein RI367_002145 [Sorochytrium milnesiophthora]
MAVGDVPKAVLHNFKVAALREIGHYVGLQRTPVKKGDLVEAILEAQAQPDAYRKLDLKQMQQQRQVISIDVGFRNLAWVHASPDRILHWERRVLVPSAAASATMPKPRKTSTAKKSKGAGDDTRERADDDPKGKRKKPVKHEAESDGNDDVKAGTVDTRIYSPAMFARSVRSVVDDIEAAVRAQPIDTPLSIAVEQQSFRGAAMRSLSVFMVNMVEGMLWYGLTNSHLLRARNVTVHAVPPGHVAKWLYPVSTSSTNDSAAADTQEDSSDPKASARKKRLVSAKKKLTSVSLVNALLGDQEHLHIPEQYLQTYQTERKRDDMADCLLQALAWLDWSYNRITLRQQLIVGLPEVNALQNGNPHSWRARLSSLTADNDRYGFKKESQHVSKEEYAAWEKGYRAVLDKQADKWERYQAAFGNKDPFADRSPELKKLIRNGIPNRLRRQVWLQFSTAGKRAREGQGVYRTMVAKEREVLATGARVGNEFVDIIERDLNRTFPENIHFKLSTSVPGKIPSPPPYTSPEPLLTSLRNVLVAFSFYNPEIGYCQSLNYVVGLLLLFMPEEEAFWMLVVIVEQLLPPGMYSKTLSGTITEMQVLMSIIKDKCKPVLDKVHRGGIIELDMLVSPWFMTIFINILPIDEGTKILYRIALALLMLHEANILKIKDPLEVVQYIQNCPKRFLDVQTLIRCAFQRFGPTAVGHLSHIEINRKREVMGRKSNGTMSSSSSSRG